jgi:hypothetical protein
MKDPKADYALRQAGRAAKRGDLAAAERWTKVAALNQKQWEQLRARPPEVDPVEEEEAIRAELHRRLARFIGSSQDIQRWEIERDIYIEWVKRAEEAGGPMPPPLRPHPVGGDENTDPHLIEILQGPEPDGCP